MMCPRWFFSKLLLGLFLLFMGSLQAEGWSKQKQELVQSYVSEKEPYRLIVLVSPRNLNYENAEAFFASLIQQGNHPTVGHAWVLLMGRNEKGEVEWVEGGHSGEFGIIAPKYFDRLLARAENDAEPNPVQILYEPLEDGVFEKGDGGCCPSFAASFSLTEKGYRTLRSLVHSDSSEYPFHKWSLLEYNCVRFILTCLGRIGIVLDASCVIQVPSIVSIRGERVRMWQDEKFKEMTLETPEHLERSLKEAVRLGQAQEALSWYVRFSK